MSRDAQGEATVFEAVIVPHRSLGRRGLAVLIAAVCVLSLLTVARFWLIGAWPVAVFSVAEIGLFLLLIRLNVLRGRASEMLLLSAEELRVVRIDRHGRREDQAVAAGWLRVVLRERPGRVPALFFASRGTEIEVAASLGETEKRDLAQALQDALQQQRSPRFDNPQLRA